MRVFSFVVMLALASSSVAVQAVGAQSVRSFHMTIAGVPAAPAEQDSTEASWQGRVLTALGGAVVGAGLGFFASQVRTGDWDTGAADVNRPAWAAAGGAIGLAVGLSFPIGGSARQGPRVMEIGRDLILGEEVRRLASVSNAYEAVEMLRPEWLIRRGTGNWRETPRGSMSGMGSVTSTVDVEEAEATIRAYVDDVALGKVEALKDISTEAIVSIRFLTPAAATTRWGAGHQHGAILVTTR